MVVGEVDDSSRPIRGRGGGADEATLRARPTGPDRWETRVRLVGLPTDVVKGVDSAAPAVVTAQLGGARGTPTELPPPVGLDGLDVPFPQATPATADILAITTIWHRGLPLELEVPSPSLPFSPSSIDPRRPRPPRLQPGTATAYEIVREMLNGECALSLPSGRPPSPVSVHGEPQAVERPVGWRITSVPAVVAWRARGSPVAAE